MMNERQHRLSYEEKQVMKVTFILVIIGIMSLVFVVGAIETTPLVKFCAVFPHEVDGILISFGVAITVTGDGNVAIYYNDTYMRTWHFPNAGGSGGFLAESMFYDEVYCKNLKLDNAGDVMIVRYHFKEAWWPYRRATVGVEFKAEVIEV